MAAKKHSDLYISDTLNEICDLMVNEKLSLRSVLLKDGMPSSRTFYQWIANDEDKEKQYARACKDRADALFDELLDIADDGQNDYMIKNGYTALDSEHIQRSKLRVDTRKWALAKMNPRKYGDKLDVTTDGEKVNERPSFVSVNKSNE